VITPEVIRGYVDWSVSIRRRTLNGLRNGVLHGIHALTWQHPLFTQNKTDDYGWFSEMLKALPRESKTTLRDRQLQRRVSHKLLADLPPAIHEDRIRWLGKDPLKEAWLCQCELFFSLAWYRPWRQRNHRECKIHKTGDITPNIYYGVITDEIRRQIRLPRNLEIAWRKDSKEKYLLCRFVEWQTKTGKEVWELFPPSVNTLFDEFVNGHRDVLIGEQEDPGTLFVTRLGKPMNARDMVSMVAHCSRRYAKTRFTPHAIRAAVAAYCQEKGGSLSEVRRMLWHADKTMSWEYAGGPNASLGVSLLARHREGLHRKAIHAQRSSSPER
jgi:hypothetical protein